MGYTTEQHLQEVAADNGLSVSELKEAIDYYRAAKVAARETTGRAKGEPRPEKPAAVTEAIEPAKPAAIEWPSVKWKGSPEELSRKRFAIITYLRRVWKPFIENNNVIVTREILKERDADAASALKLPPNSALA